MDKKRLGSFVIGGLAGLLAGLLIAPKSGRETRGGFADRAGEARQRSSETYFEARERLRERVSATRGQSVPPTNDLTHAPSAADLYVPEPGPDAPGEDLPDMPDPRPAEAPAERPFLRDVSRDANYGVVAEPNEGLEESAASEGGRSEALRRKIRETRARLKSQGTKPHDVSPDDVSPGDGSGDDAR
ncbi:MAG: YtxH domain-containing protein [Rubrobacter sp.]